MSGIHGRFKELFDVNIVSIVIAFLIYLVIADWFKVIKNFYSVRSGSVDVKDDINTFISFIDDSEGYMEDIHGGEKIKVDRYKITKRKFWSALVVTIVTVFFIVIMYEWWHMSHDTES